MVAYFPGITAAGTLAPGLAAATVRNTLGLGTADSQTFANVAINANVTSQAFTISSSPLGIYSARTVGFFHTSDGAEGGVRGVSQLLLAGPAGVIVQNNCTFSGNIIQGSIRTHDSSVLLGRNLSNYNGRLQVVGGTETDSLIVTSGLINNFINRIEQRNGTNGQRFLLAKTWTSATNHEYLELDAASDASNYRIGSRIGSAGGTTRGLQFGNWNAAGAFTEWASLSTAGQLASLGRYALGTDLGLHPVAGGASSLQTFHKLRLAGGSGVVPQSYSAGNGPGGRDTSHVEIQHNHANRIGLEFSGVASQTGNFIEAFTLARASVFSVSSNGSVSVGGNITAASLPTSDPAVAGRIWRSGNDLKISTG
jgi:hypothetical protein